MSYFDTAVLAASFDRRIAPGTDLLDLLFPNEFTSDREKIVFDEIQDDQSVANYVRPDVETPDGKAPIVGASEFQPSYIKERNTVKPGEGQVRRVGEALYGSDAAGSRFEQAVEDILDRHQNRITRREILQASEVLRTGRVTIAGDNYPTRVVNYNRDAALADALTSGNRWGDSGVSIADYIEAKADKMGEISGAVSKVMLLGSSAKNAFVNDAAIRERLDNRNGQGVSAYVGTIGTGKKTTMRLVGYWGDLEVWKYVQTYKDASGTTQHMFPANGMALLDPETFAGIRCYGAILDRKAGLQPLKRFAKVWDAEDPAVTLAMTQSAPLMVPAEVNASFFATVTA